MCLYIFDKHYLKKGRMCKIMSPGALELSVFPAVSAIVSVCSRSFEGVYGTQIVLGAKHVKCQSAR